MANAIIRDDKDDSFDRVGYFSHAIDKGKLRPGDHIYSWRGIYQHHGIYIGEEGREVIHSGIPTTGDEQNEIICATSLDDFLDGHDLHLVAYDVTVFGVFFKVHGLRHSCKSRFLNDVVATAKHYCANPQEWGAFSSILNNSEDFAYYCKTQQPLTNGQFSKINFPKKFDNAFHRHSLSH